MSKTYRIAVKVLDNAGSPQFDRALTCCDRDAFVDRQDRPRLAVSGDRHDFDQLQIAAEDARPRIERSEFVVDRRRRIAPVNFAFLLLDFRRIRRFRMILFRFHEVAPERPRHFFSTDPRQPARERRRPLVHTNRRLRDRQDGTVVQLDVDAHDRDAGLGLAMLDRTLNRRRAAILRKNRTMDVEKPALRNLQKCGRKNLSIRHDDADIGLRCRNLIDRVADF